MSAGKLRPPVKIAGGKSYLCGKINALLPIGRGFGDLYGGGGSVLLNRKRSEVEIFNDLNPRRANLMCVIRDHLADFKKIVDSIPYNEQSFETAKARDEAWKAKPGCIGSLDKFEAIARAADYAVRVRMSRGGIGETYSWSDRLRRGKPENVSSWETVRLQLSASSERLQGVHVCNMDAMDVLLNADAEDFVAYLDPPYVQKTRTVKNVYEYEMSDADHARMAQVALSCKGVVAISGYDCDEYNAWFAGWAKHTFDMPNHASQAKEKQRRIEVLWINR